jgi:histidinol-phosphate aminotransferase
VTNALLKVHVPFSVNSLAQAAGIASLHAKDELLARTDAVVAERERVVAELRAAGYSVPPSQANFVWIDLADDTTEFAQDAMNAGVIIRPFAGEGARVTVTHAAENNRFLAFARDRAAR